MAINLVQSNPGDQAAKNIINVINAAADARTAQTELQKQIMLKQISDKMDLQKQAQQQIQEKNINYNYTPGGDNSNIANPAPTTPTAMDMASPLGQNGVANSATPTAVASPIPQGNDAFSMAKQGQPQPQAAPQPQPTPQQTLTAPAQATGGQPIVPPSPTQAPSNPVLNSPAATPGGAPIMPTSIQYNKLGYQPVEAPQILAERQKNGQSPNVADAHYVQALNKVKAGTATEGEIGMVNKMNNRTPEGNQIPPPGQPAIGGTVPNSGDKPLRMMEQKLGYPEGSLWRNPQTMAPELSPIWKAKMEATQRAQANYDVNQPFREDKRQDGLEAKYADRLSKIVSYRSGSLGVQDGKVNSGIHALALLDQTYDPQTKTFNIPPIMQSELAANVNNAISNQNVTSDSMRQDLQQRSIYGDWNKTMQYILNTPKNSLPQDNAKLLAAMVIRQGPVAENERDKDMQDLKSEVPSGLDPDRAKKLEQIQFGNSFKEQLGKSQFYKDLFQNDPKYKDIMGGGQSGSNGDQSNGSSSAGQYQEGQTATNPQTGQKLTYRGGQWQ